MTRRIISIILMLLGGAAGVAGCVWLLEIIGDFHWAKTLEREQGITVEMILAKAWQGVAISSALFVLGYILSFNPRARSRAAVWIGLGIGALGTGALPGLVLRIVLPRHDLMVSEGWADQTAYMMMIGGGVALALLLFAFEFGNRLLWRSLGNHAEENGNEGLAIMAGRFALLFQPGEAKMLRAVALADFRAGDRKDAPEVLQRLHAEGRRDPDLLEALCQHAAEQKKKGEYLGYLRELNEVVPNDSQLTKALFDELADQGFADEAVALYRKRELPGDDDARERFALLLAERGEDNEAVAAARALGRAEGIPFRRSQKILRDILARSPNCAPACNLLAEQAERMAMRDQRQRWLEKSFEADPRQADVRDALRAAYTEGGQTLRLLKLLQGMVSADPGDVSTWLELVETMMAAGKEDEALAELEELHKRHRPFAASKFVRARIHFERGEFSPALTTVREALALETHAARRAPMELLERKAERAQLSADLADRMDRAQANPDDISIQIDVIERLMTGGHADRVHAFIDTLLRAHPEARPDVIECLQTGCAKGDVPFGLLNLLADLQAQAGLMDDALDTVKAMEERAVNRTATARDGTQRILRRQPHHLPTLEHLAQRYAADGNQSETIHHYALFLAHGGVESPEISRTLARCYLAIGSYDRAKVHALRLNIDNAKPDVELLREMIPIAIEAGAPEDAAEFLKGVEIGEPGTARTRALKDVVARGLGGKRFAFLKRELEAGKGSAETLEQLGDIARELMNLNDAITYYQRASREPSIGKRAKVKLAWAFAKKKLYDVSSETLAEVTLTLSDDPRDMAGMMDMIYEIAEMFYEANLQDRSLKLFKTLMKIDAGYKDVLRRVETLR